MSAVLDRIVGYTPERILLEFGDKDNVTTDIFSIAENIGIDLVQFDFSETEKTAGAQADTVLGAIVDGEDGLSILLKNKLSSVPYYEGKTEGEKIDILRRRQRFTVAHEIAHACLHLEKQDVRFRIDFNKDIDEYIKEEYVDEYNANVFAGQLLLPEDLVIKVKGLLIKPTIEAFSQIFDVSKTVVRERLKYLGMLDEVVDVK